MSETSELTPRQILGYPPDDDQAAHDLIDEHLRGDDRLVWSALISDEYVDQTARVLRQMSDLVQRDFVRFRAQDIARTDMFRRGQMAATAYSQHSVDYAQWKRRAKHFQYLLTQRRDEGTPVVNARRHDANGERIFGALIALAEAVRGHQRRTEEEMEPSEPDKQLWEQLDRLRVPYGRRPQRELALTEVLVRREAASRELEAEAGAAQELEAEAEAEGEAMASGGER